MADYLKVGIDGVKDLFTWLTDKSKSKDVIKNNLMREIRDNIKILEHRDKENVNRAGIIDGISAAAIEAAYLANFNFNQLAEKNKHITKEFILNKRQEKYIGWDCKKTIYSIEGKIKDIKNLPKLYANINEAPVNLSVRLDNLFFQMLLFAIFLSKNN